MISAIGIAQQQNPIQLVQLTYSKKNNQDNLCNLSFQARLSRYEKGLNQIDKDYDIKRKSINRLTAIGTLLAGIVGFGVSKFAFDWSNSTSGWVAAGSAVLALFIGLISHDSNSSTAVLARNDLYMKYHDD